MQIPFGLLCLHLLQSQRDCIAKLRSVFTGEWNALTLLFNSSVPFFYSPSSGCGCLLLSLSLSLTHTEDIVLHIFLWFVLLDRRIICSNDSLGLCQCRRDEWKTLEKGLWDSVMSPYEEKYVDVKYIGNLFGSTSITVEEGQSKIKWKTLFLYAKICRLWYLSLFCLCSFSAMAPLVSSSGIHFTIAGTEHQ